jgi:AT-rich interactive domain-containing protein 1
VLHIYNTFNFSLNSEGSPMPPPSTTPNSHSACGPTSISHNPVESTTHTESINDTSIISNIPVSTIATITTSSNTVTSVVTTGPDGTSLDEGSQQSTLSNASAG